MPKNNMKNQNLNGGKKSKAKIENRSLLCELLICLHKYLMKNNKTYNKHNICNNTK